MRGDASIAPIDRIRNHLVGLRMPRALETLEHVVQQLERGQLGAKSYDELNAWLLDKCIAYAKAHSPRASGSDSI